MKIINKNKFFKKFLHPNYNDFDFTKIVRLMSFENNLYVQEYEVKYITNKGQIICKYINSSNGISLKQLNNFTTVYGNSFEMLLTNNMIIADKILLFKKRYFKSTGINIDKIII